MKAKIYLRGGNVITLRFLKSVSIEIRNDVCSSITVVRLFEPKFENQILLTSLALSDIQAVTYKFGLLDLLARVLQKD
jgi:hypothetical protein